MNRNRNKNRKKETGAVVSLFLVSSLAFGGCGTAVTSSSSVNTESVSYTHLTLPTTPYV